MRYRIGSVYLGILGTAILLFGGLDIVFALTGGKITTGLLMASGSMWVFWKGLILTFSGIFILGGSIDLRNIHGLGKAVLGSVMLWIVAGCNIFERITQSIPGEEGWFNSVEGFLSSYAPPYEPELWLLPFSLLILYFIVKSGDSDKEEARP